MASEFRIDLIPERLPKACFLGETSVTVRTYQLLV